MWNCVPALLGLTGAPKAWDSLGLTRAQSGCVFFDLSDGSKSGRHVDDFMISGPHAAVERQMDTTASTMDLRGVLRLYGNGFSGILVGMDNVKIVGDITL